MKIIVPADANQADCAVRYAMSVDSAVAIIGGRSKMPVLSDKNGAALGFEYGKADYMCEGNDGVIITYGNVVHRAVNASKMLSADGAEKSSAARVLARKSLSAARSAILWLPLPGFPQYCEMHRSVSLITDGGFGKVVAALSR